MPNSPIGIVQEFPNSYQDKKSFIVAILPGSKKILPVSFYFIMLMSVYRYFK